MCPTTTMSEQREDTQMRRTAKEERENLLIVNGGDTNCGRESKYFKRDVAANVLDAGMRAALLKAEGTRHFKVIRATGFTLVGGYR